MEKLIDVSVVDELLYAAVVVDRVTFGGVKIGVKLV